MVDAWRQHTTTPLEQPFTAPAKAFSKFAIVLWGKSKVEKVSFFYSQIYCWMAFLLCAHHQKQPNTLNGLRVIIILGFFSWTKTLNNLSQIAFYNHWIFLALAFFFRLHRCCFLPHVSCQQKSCSFHMRFCGLSQLKITILTMAIKQAHFMVHGLWFFFRQVTNFIKFFFCMWSSPKTELHDSTEMCRFFFLVKFMHMWLSHF